MEHIPLPSGDSVAFAEELYLRFLADPSSVDADWRAYFESFEWAATRRAEPFANPRDTAPRSPGKGDGGAGLPARAPSSSRGGAVAAPVKLTRELEARLPFLEGLALFEAVPANELRQVAAIAEEIRVGDQHLLFKQNDLGQDVYIVVDGTVQIRRSGRLIATLGRGEVVGEMAVVDSQPRSADAITRGPATILRVRGQALLELLEQRPLLARGVLRVMSKRLRDTGARQDLVDQLIRAYRVRGHLLADLNPLAPPTRTHAELDPSFYGFTPADMDSLFSSATIPGAGVMTLRDILDLLKTSYCGSIGVQFMHIDELRIKDWIQERMENPTSRRVLSKDEQRRILSKLTDAEIFEQFIHAKFVGAKRFSLEGAESMIPLLDLAIEEAAAKGINEVVIGMAHRGRLNVLANIMGKSPKQIFREFDDANPEKFKGGGDVKYHLGFSADRQCAAGPVHLSLAFNPSHLEFVGPVVLGRVRAKQDRFKDKQRKKGLGIIIHGDAAFAGQGVVQEMLNMSELEGYSTGGTVHVVVNNQIGFTTDPNEARSTTYATDVAKLLQVPIFHVNGEQPEAVAQVIRLAMDFRETFQKDVIIDMYCYRRHGHNEGDEPAFTQPQLYEKIKRRKTVREAYIDNLLAIGGLSREDADEIAVKRRIALEQDLGVARSAGFATQDILFGQGVWKGFKGGADADVPEVDTTVPRDRLSELLLVQAQVPAGFTPHPKVARLLKGREQMARGEAPLDWAAGEALAFASLLTNGTRIRLSGQDAERGTFSHRHSVLHDVKTGVEHTALNHLAPSQAPFEVRNSPLTEIAVLGFEYGYSLDYPDGLVIWEAQFGDFVNVAQVIIDQFITSGEDKWNRLSGLVMLLPHGFEGQGPEHSSARLERFLSLVAKDNIQVMNLTTPAQYFHALRRQIVRPLRKPTIIMSPKSLLRHPDAVSTLDELATGSFQRIIPDVSFPTKAEGQRVRKVLLTSGKIYYELAAARREQKADDVAIVRIEQYAPLRMNELDAALAPYADGTPALWVQEEPANMGAWPFLALKLGAKVAGRLPLGVVARAESATPATGSAAAHKKEQADLITAALAK
ncbi:2-oxoglutarate dehydrogenase E1 component [Myxococcota bacterium]|nr:2-oxoglutarate dehydrogenase E1 component [Myxococcota bacterium]